MTSGTGPLTIGALYEAAEAIAVLDRTTADRRLAVYAEVYAPGNLAALKQIPLGAFLAAPQAMRIAALNAAGVQTPNMEAFFDILTKGIAEVMQALAPAPRPRPLISGLDTADIASLRTGEVTEGNLTRYGPAPEMPPEVIDVVAKLNAEANNIAGARNVDTATAAAVATKLREAATAYPTDPTAAIKLVDEALGLTGPLEGNGYTRSRVRAVREKIRPAM